MPIALSFPLSIFVPALAFLPLMKSGKAPAAYLTTNSRVLSSGACKVLCMTIAPSRNVARHFHYFPRAFIPLE